MEKLTSNDVAYYAKCLLVFVVTFGFGYLPPFASLTPLGMKAIGIFIGVLLGWAMIDMLWPSLLGIFAVGLSGYMNMSQSFACAFGDNITLQMLFILIFVAYLELCGCANYIARWFVTRKCAVGKPWVLSLLILTVGFVLSMFTMGTSAIIITWVIFYEVCGLFKMTKEDKWTRIMLWGIVFSGLIGAICLPYQVMSVIFIGATEQSAHITVNTLVFSAFRITTGYFLVILYWAVCKYILKPDTTKLIEAGDVFIEMRQMKITYDQKIGLTVFAVFLFMLVVIANLPKSWPLVGLLRSLGLLGTVVFLIMVLSIIRIHRNGVQESIMHFNQLTKKVNWTTVILLGGVAPMSKLLESPEAGVFSTLLGILEPMAQTLGPVAFILALSILLFCLTQISHNIVLARLATPLIIPLGVSVGIDPVLMLSAIIVPTQMAFCTPGASANAALVWSNTEWITRSSLMKLTLICAVLVIFYNSFIIVPLSCLVF